MIRTHLFALIFLGIISLNVAPPFQNSPMDHAECIFEEGRRAGNGPRNLTIDCTNPQGRKYSCTYRGNPHNCQWYNNNNQARYYIGLADAAARDQPTACSRRSLMHRRQCRHIVFNKIQ
ncbi:hypothetical protein ACJMK2_033099 [Sinanodonta woodiana]|uniref:Secreted protein n=1 Tax=Sinanodonta woodiana TaxID=1069815 RepID=A0ABD3X5Y4_SINWO